MKKAILAFSSVLVLIFLIIPVTTCAGYSFSSATNKFPDDLEEYLIPEKIDWVRANPYGYILKILTKAQIPEQSKEETGWIIGLDLDNNVKTGEKWSKIGSEYNLIVTNKDEQWQVLYENTTTKVKLPLSNILTVKNNEIRLNITFYHLGYPEQFKWQIAVVKGEKSYVLSKSGGVYVGSRPDGGFSGGCH